MNIDTLTNSQQQVFVLLIRGKSNLEIASELGKTKKNSQSARHSTVPKTRVQNPR